ncbi:hypothetical protein JGH11_13735 [Dysgonomonas sp. Marseille-P4677]|uniref:hypothetical protein n=1 Tax=Dysgonomonas sp. Marseille-P4677 TaxID=2364790 RepID=UPI001912D9DF|nr:hypothetical protein [Dysgonomonas sp. Marseille-P4677]MBK5721936.1 hypothetical protein [Dysgonomonas sp. Marseille-P4677]
MDIKIYKILVVLAIAFTGLFAFSGCTKEYITEEHNEYYEGAFVHREFVTVRANQWVWNPDINSYEYFYKIAKLTEASAAGNTIYDDGAMVASVFVNPGTKDENQEVLPFVNTYLHSFVAGPTMMYTETISCSFKPDGVWFYIQSSDLEEDDSRLFDYEFKVSIFWD